MEKKISLIGAGQIGGTLAHLITIKELADVVLFDVVEGIAKGKALDIAQSTSVEGFNINLIGTNNYEDTRNSDVIIITAGIPRKPGMTRDDLLETNLKIIRQVAKGIKKTSPNAFVICITNPLDVIVMALQKYSGFPTNKVIGMAGILDSSRFKYFLSQEIKVPVKNIKTLVLGGHGDTMVPMPTHTTVDGKSMEKLIKENKITKEKLEKNNFTKAINFSRKNLSKQNSNIYYHIGIYAYKVSVLEKFINLNQTKNEIENHLEQLRALDNNITIMVALAKSSPIGVDTKEDFIAIKKIMEYKT